MTRKRADSPGGDEQPPSALSRRRILYLSGVGVTGSLAGCSTDGSDNGAPETDDIGTETNDTADSPTTEADESGFDASLLSESHSTHIAPTDGFADASWLMGAEVNVAKVTTLDESGEGSLRWAVNRPGRTVVVFEVGGVVDLEGEGISIARSNCYVAGQTAPSPGITVVRGGLSIQGDNVILQHLRVRPGDEIPSDSDCISNAGGSNVVVDHCSTSWGTDESISTNAGETNPDITFSNNLIAQSLHDSIHQKGPHAYGTLVMNRSERVAVAGNCWAHNTGRHPRLKGGSTTVVVNNVGYNFERACRLGGGVADLTESSIVGNYYKAGELTDTNDAVVDTTFTDAEGDVEAYVAYNETEPSSMPVVGSASITQTDTRPLWPDGLESVTGQEAFDAVLQGVGARPADRTEHDERIVGDVRNGTGERIDSQADVGGYPDLDRTERELDVPDEDLAEWLREFTVAVEG